MGVIAYSVLIGYFFLFLVNSAGRLKIRLNCAGMMIVFSFIIIIACWPLYTGDVAGSLSPEELPRCYYAVKREIDASKEDANVLILPDNLSPFFDWLDKDDKLLSAWYFENSFFSKPVIFLFILSFSEQHKFLYSQLQGDVPLDKLLALYNVKHVILHKDYLINNDFKKPNRNYHMYKDKIAQAGTLKLERDGEYLEYYTLADSCFLPKVFVPTSITYIHSGDWLDRVKKNPRDLMTGRTEWQTSVNSGTRMRPAENGSYSLLSKVLARRDSAVRNLYFLDDLMPGRKKFLSDVVKSRGHREFFVVSGGQPAKVMQTYPAASLPTIRVSKIHPTKYLISVSNARDGFPLVFSESFHGGWKLYLRALGPDFKAAEKCRIWDTWFKEPFCDEEHILANGYANAWWIDPDNVRGQGAEIKNYYENPDGSIDFEMILEYWPQRLFYLGLLVSIIGFFICLSYLFVDSCHRRRVG
jgi:hypothetical protein